jgi:FkbM family methyltransferase
MNPIKKIFSALCYVANHPVNRHRKFRAITEYGFIQIAARIVPGDVCVRFPNGTQLVVSPRMKGAAHFIAPRLNEFDEMSFVMHFLRAGDLFADVGANVGAFTVLAAGVAGAKTVSFEPSLETYEMLLRNIRINNLADRARPVNAAVGRSVGSVRFSASLGTENHVASTSENENSVAVSMTTLDQELTPGSVTLLKVDVEGFETEVFGGAEQTLKNPALHAIIIEKNGSGNRYGYDESALHAKIRSHGFAPFAYEPLTRRLNPFNEADEGNIIYIRDLVFANNRLSTATPFTLDGLKV